MKRHHWLILGLLLLMILPACGSSTARYNNQGNEDFQETNYDDALEEYTAAKENNPEAPEPYYNSGNAFHQKGDLKSAVDQTQQSLRLADDKLAQRAFYNLGNSYFLAEDWPAAIKAYQEALLLNPDDKDAKHNLELALRNVQRQQGNQTGEGPSQPQDSPGNQQGDSDQNQPQGQGEQEQPGGGGDQENEEQEGPGGQDDSDQEGEGEGELTEEEAEQLLDNLSQNSQTLQERLNETYDGQGQRRPPAQDW